MGTQDSTDRRALLKDALAALDEMQAKLDARERERREPIAIVGMSCRFPGGADSPASLWALLHDGVDAVGPIPRDRWDAEAYYDPDANAPGKTYVREGGFLDRVDLFEPQFFGISPREANSLDPQQRLLLETAWEALEHAGQAPDRLTGTRTGVFVGITTADYAKLIDFSDPANADVYAATGNALNAAAGRIAFTLGLQGPCASVDTACSSSLVAIHLACQSLRTGESTMAIAGGVNVMLVPEPLILFSKWGMIARDARCKTFDARADGFVRSEGCGVLILKRLSDAVANHDCVLAVIAGSAVNQDGRSSGLTVPNGVAQQAVVRAALDSAGLRAEQVDYVEAHGTGTPLGDPIEIEALAAAMASDHTAAAPLRVGSIKTNIGHAEAASGVAGVMKVVLALQHEEIPAHLHLEALNPRIAWDRLPLSVPVEATSWPRRDRPRYAGVSSFGFSGTNAHLIVGEAPPAMPVAPVAADRPLHILTLSARTDAARRRLAERYEQALSSEAVLANVCYTANTGRAHLSRRAAVVAATAAEAREALRAVAADAPAPGTTCGTPRGTDAPKVAFLFTGQGSQYVGMARSLYDTQPTFRRALRRCDEVFRDLLSTPLLPLLYDAEGDERRLDETIHTQPALFAIEYALAELWRAWGVEPQAVLGHSIGEFAAACVAGVLTLEDAARLVAARGRLMQSLPAGGAMAAVFADEERVAAAVAPHAARLSIAAINGPSNVVISGAAEAVAIVRASLAEEGIRTEPLRVSHAFHSPLMSPILAEFESVARTARPQSATLGLVSNVTGTFVKPGQIDSMYWRRHVASPVRFGSSMQALYDQGYRVFLEVGPMPTLTTMARRFLGGDEVRWLASLRQGKPDWAQMLEALSGLYVAGIAVDWDGFDRDYPRQRVALPTYPFERERCWIAPREHSSAKARHHEDGGTHPLLGVRSAYAGSEGTHLWDGELSLDRFPYLADHCVQGMPVVPATAYAEMAVAAASEILGEGTFVLRNIEYRKPLFLTPQSRAITQVILERKGADDCEVRVFSRPGAAPGPGAWTFHMRGRVARRAVAPTAVDLAGARERCRAEMTGAAFYSVMAGKGNEWGATFQGVRRLLRGQGEAVSEVDVPEKVAGTLNRYVFHPAVADASGHVLVAAAPFEGEGSRGGAFVGGAIDEVRVYRPARGRSFVNYARVRPDETAGDNVLVGDVAVFDETGALVGETIGARLFYLDATEQGARQAKAPVDEWTYELAWTPAERGERRSGMPPAPAAPWLILADDDGLGAAVAGRFRQAGTRAVVVTAGAAFSAEDGGDRFVARPGERGDLARVVDEALVAGAGACAGVLNLWSLNVATRAGNAAALEAAIDAGCATTLALVQETLARTWTVAPRMWLVTERAMHVNGDVECAAAQAPLWGFGRALALEHTELWGGLIDIDRGDTAALAASIVEELTTPDGEDQIAYRDGIRHAARLVPAPVEGTAPALRFRPDASYFVSGGLGGLGLEVARWMVSQGARRLILAARTPLPPRSEWARAIESGGPAADRLAAVRCLEALGASVHPVALDVADEGAVEQFLQTWAREGWPAIRGVVHAAGVVQYEAMLQHSREAMHAVMRPKVVGGWLLSELLGDALDFFVSFSSASAILSSPLTASYAGANSFLDALAWQRRAQGRAALSVNWGLWSDVGMVARFTQGTPRSSTSARLIPPAAGIESLERLLASGRTQAAVMPIGWREWPTVYPAFAGAPLLAALFAAPAGGASPQAQPAPTTTGLTRADLATAPTHERPAMIASYLLSLVSSVLGLRPETIDPQQSLTAMGLDSLMAVELKNRIESDLGFTVPIVRFLEGSHIEQICAMLVTQAGAGLETGAPVALAAGVDYEEGEI